MTDGSVSSSRSRSSRTSTSRSRNDWKGWYHSRSQWVCGTMETVRATAGEARPAGPRTGDTPRSVAFMETFLQVTTAAGSREEADLISRALVERRLAACVQVVGPVESRYWWDGGVEVAREWLCLAKTTAALYSAVEGAIRELHSYEVPEIVALPVAAGSEAYLGWVQRETAMG